MSVCFELDQTTFRFGHLAAPWLVWVKEWVSVEKKGSGWQVEGDENCVAEVCRRRR